MKPTCDLFDDHGDALRVLPPALRHYGAKTAFHGPAVTVKTFEVNSRVKELANMPGEGRVMVVLNILSKPVQLSIEPGAIQKLN